MSVKPSLHPAVLDARLRIEENREKARAQHNSGAAGRQVCFLWTDAVDNILLDIIHAAAEINQLDAKLPGIALVAHGGFGRRDLAPYSDIDLMLLYRRNAEAQAIALSRSLAQMIVDAGLQLGFSTRTSAQARSLAWTDAAVFTSISESRQLYGDEQLFDSFRESFRIGAHSRARKLIPMIQKARMEEQSGETSYLLHPNIKRSRGGLRDVQFVRWVGFAHYGESEPDQLEEMQLLTAEDCRAITNGYNYLLRLRNQMHFSAGRAVDTLDRTKQLELAKWAGFEGSDGLLPVEQFMQEYFTYTSEIRYSSRHFAESTKTSFAYTNAVGRFFSRSLGNDYRIGLNEIWPARRRRESIIEDPAKIIELMLLANVHNRRIEHRTWLAIRDAMLKRPPTPPSNETIARFSLLMNQSRKLGPMLRRLHELRVLEQIIPGFKHARFLLQFNEYHKYTVDAHCILSVQEATQFATENNLLGTTYRNLKNKALLHLALLIHDLGKGFSEDHSEVGARIAADTADQLRLNPADKELLVFLVHKHLNMTHTALRYDLSEKDTIVAFAKQVGSVDALQMLFILSCADLAAVGPGSLTDWKMNLLQQLYESTLHELGSNDEPVQMGFVTELERRRTEIGNLAARLQPADWWQTQIAKVPAAYMFLLSNDQIIEELKTLQALTTENPIAVWGSYREAQNATQYVVAVRQVVPIGLFARITGALTSLGLNILSGEVYTQPGEIAWDRFLVIDSDFDGPPPLYRIKEVCAKILAFLKSEQIPTPTYRKIWSAKSSNETLQHQPVQVRFDNNTSDKYTIITVFTYDRPGLLFEISKTIYDSELVLHSAKFSTHLDQVVDVFYVTTLDRRKVTESTQLYTLRQSLLKSIDVPPTGRSVSNFF
jgi:[protein-PII] uridylyltransferase